MGYMRPCSKIKMSQDLPGWNAHLVAYFMMEPLLELWGLDKRVVAFRNSFCALGSGRLEQSIEISFMTRLPLHP